MKKLLVALIVLVIAGGLYIPAEAAEETLTTPVISISFQGTPQWGELKIINTGTIILTLDPASHPFPGHFDNGRVWYKTYTGTYRIDWNGWVIQPDNTYVWEMSLPSNVQQIWIDTFPFNLVHWEGYGPWVPATVGYTYSGIQKTEQETKITISVNEPLFQDWTGIGDPTVDWPVTAEPAWAVESYAKSGELNFQVETSCSGFGDNHGGLFEWNVALATENTFGNGIFREHLLEPLVSSTWTLSRPDGTILASGETLAPSCAESILRLPVVMK